jgi:hypothetical protein
MENNNIYTPESIIVNNLISYLKSIGYNEIYTEAQFIEKFVDVFAYSKEKDCFIAIEAKVKSPSRAFDQAKKYLHFADYVFVATFKNSTNKKAKELSKNSGIGLILIEKDEKDCFHPHIETDSMKSQYIKRDISNMIMSNLKQSRNYNE